MHSFTTAATVWTIDKKYAPTRTLSACIVQATDTDTGKKVVLKKLLDVYRKPSYTWQLLKRLKLLRRLKHENIVELLDVVEPRSQGSDDDDLCVVLGALDADMQQIISSNNDLTNELVQFFMYQLLSGLRYMHSAGVLHRELKPSHLLLTAECDLKITGLSNARVPGMEDEQEEFEGIVARWYRAPELLLSCAEHDAMVDVWSAGCIMAELLGRELLFPGDDSIQQINLIVDMVGTPSNEELGFVASRSARRYMSSLKPRQKREWAERYPAAHPDALDLLDKMLRFNPRDRISVDEALAHPYLAECVAGLDNHTHTVEKPLRLETVPLNEELLQEAVVCEVAAFRPNATRLLPSGLIERRVVQLLLGLRGGPETPLGRFAAHAMFEPNVLFIVAAYHSGKISGAFAELERGVDAVGC